MKINTQLATLLNKEMDRKDFLKYCGMALLAVVGFGSILNALSQPNVQEKSKLRNRYGNNPYGG